MRSPALSTATFLNMKCDTPSSSLLEEIADASSLDLAQIEDVYPCTPLQMGCITSAAVDDNRYKHTNVVSLAPSIDLDRFIASIQRITSLHAVFRTRIVDSSQGMVQVVTRAPICVEQPDRSLDEQIREETLRPMGVAVPLLRCAIVGKKLVVTMQHAIMDGWTNVAFLTDVTREYHGQEPVSRVPFKQFVEYCTDIDDGSAKQLWADQFRVRGSIFPTVPSEHNVLASETERKTIRIPGLGTKVSLAWLPSQLEIACALTVRTYTASGAVAFGLISSGRTSTFQSTVGPTIAVVPTQIQFGPSTTIQELLKERNSSKRRLWSSPALHYGLSKIRHASEEAAIAAEFQTLVNIRSEAQVAEAQGASGSDDLKFEDQYEPRYPYALSLTCIINKDGLLAELVYDPGVLCRMEVKRILRQFEHVLSSLLSVPLTTKISQISLLSPPDRSEIFDWNREVPKAVEASLHDLFTLQATQRGTAIAIEASDGSLTYKQLEEMSGIVAFDLQRRGVSQGTLVPFVSEKSQYACIAILGILKAGAVCVPIDPSHPQARKDAIITSTRAKVILASESACETFLSHGVDLVVIDAEHLSSLQNPQDKALAKISPDAPAYIIFTSGSTGTPKGVVLTHRNLASSLTHYGQRVEWKPDLRMLQFSAHVWDTHILEILGTLLFGGCVCVPSEQDRESNLAGFVRDKLVNFAFLTPTILRTISPEEVPHLKTIVSCGEPVEAEAIKTWTPSHRFINEWGPCEASICCTLTELTSDSPYLESIGTAVGCATWIVDPEDSDRLLPIGAVGELVIEGPGVAKGYLNDSVKTDKSFILPPAWMPRGRASGRLYRTGDLAKYYPDGSLCFVGRLDSQVKIRGQRFELGEVESTLSKCEGVRDVFAAVHLSGRQKELVAVMTLAGSDLPSTEALKEVEASDAITQHHGRIKDSVAARLPSYMLPKHWIVVERMPITTSGKLDRTAVDKWLKARDFSSTHAHLGSEPSMSLTAPVSDNEKMLQSICSSNLRIPQDSIGRESNFGALGGDSISAMRVANQCRKRGIQVSVRSLLEKHSSLKRVAEECQPVEENQLVKNAIPASLPSAAQLAELNDLFEADNVEAVVHATDMQALSIAISERQPEAFWNQTILHFSSPLQHDMLEKACSRVIEHHPILRTAFVQWKSDLLQVVLKSTRCNVIVEEGSKLILPNSPELGFLPRFYLTSAGEGCIRLRLEIHHSLYDAMSLDLILQDLAAAYTGVALSEGSTFHDWISQISSLDQTPARKYWSELLKDSSAMTYLVPPPTNPTHNPAPSERRILLHLPISTLHAPDSTPSTVLKAAWALTLSHNLKTNDLIFFEATSNRTSPLPSLPDLHLTRGPCLNLTPVRAHLTPTTTLSTLIADLQAQSLASLPYQNLGFHSLIKSCTAWPPPSSEFRFGSVLVFQNHGSLEQSSYKFKNTTVTSMTGDAGVGDSADVWVIAKPKPEEEEVEVELRFVEGRVGLEMARGLARELEGVLRRVGKGELDSVVGRNVLDSLNVDELAEGRVVERVAE